MTPAIAFENSYAKLPERFYARQPPDPVPAPRSLMLNTPLAAALGLDPAVLAGAGGLAILAGNTVPEGADPLAQAYAGHQFGNWVPQLGDGRALLLGEIIDQDGRRQDVQLKGAGRTRFSRGGDGRAWVGPVIREYVVSEAMNALGIPTTRALAAVATGAKVVREAILPGAILTRVAPSHIRVGTFQFFAARQDTDALRRLTDHVIERHYPEAGTPLELLGAVIARQAELIADWMNIGFIHGVMNTDNAHVAGITIDYGPCAFMDRYHPTAVYSSIDRFGRYAYRNQPDIAAWNMAQFASTLLPLMGGNPEVAIKAATKAVHRFPELYAKARLVRFRARLGLRQHEPGDAVLIDDLLDCMAAAGADFTNTFRGLANGTARRQFRNPADFDRWAKAWHTRLAHEGRDTDSARADLRAANPALIPRNHRVEQAIQAALDGDLTILERLTAALGHPFDPPPGTDDLRQPPAPEEEVTQTFCGT